MEILMPLVMLDVFRTHSGMGAAKFKSSMRALPRHSLHLSWIRYDYLSCMCMMCFINSVGDANICLRCVLSTILDLPCLCVLAVVGCDL